MSRLIQLQVKHLFDRLSAAMFLGLSLPLLAAIAVAVRWFDGSPVLFTQTRCGRGAQPFTILKFRTMVTDADRLLDPQGRVTSPGRVTKIGGYLRRLSMDELPQLVNILRGEMSVIGPRPLPPDGTARLTDQQLRRLEVKPGVTGLAQVNGRNTLKWSRRIEYDVHYVDHFSLWLDLKILLRTALVVLMQRGVLLDRNPEQVDDLPPPRRVAEEQAEVAA